MPAEGGIRFGQYVLLRRIARGGMAEVFLAQQRGLEGFDRRVAVKRILPHLLDSQDFVRMFLGEAKLAAQLAHPNVVHIYDFGKVENDYFLAMEYVEGVHAGQLWKHGEQKPGDRMPATLVARIGADAASALHYAHEMRGPGGQPLGIVHRDVSPANIMISYDGVVKLCDFGIAKAAALSDQLTNPGQVKGKYAYMSPEQTIAAPLDGRSDVFSLAIVLWELLTGKFIVPRGDAIEAMRAIRDGKLETIAQAAPNVPPQLARAITWALETKREKRATALQFAEALEAFIKSSPELGTSMQLRVWIRARFQREGTGQVPALSGPNATTAGTPGTAASTPGTLASPGTVIASGTQGPITPPRDARPRFGADLDEEVSITIKRPQKPVGGDRGDATLLDDSARLAAEEELGNRTDEVIDIAPTVARDRGPLHTATQQLLDPDAAVIGPPIRPSATTTRASSSVPAVTPVPTSQAPAAPGRAASRSDAESRSTAGAIPGSAPRRQPSIAPDLSVAATRPRTTPYPGDLARRRRIRMVLAFAGLAGLALISFAIALAASGGGRSHAVAADAPAPRPDAAAKPPADAVPLIVAPPPIDASPEAWIDVRTEPDGGSIKIGDQTRIAPAQWVVPPGHVVITGELAGYPPGRLEIDVEPGDKQTVTMVFGKKSGGHILMIGKLTVRTTPYSEVYENGKLIGTTPFAEKPMAPGAHKLVFKNPKHPTIEKTVTIAAGKTVKLSFELP